VAVRNQKNPETLIYIAEKKTGKIHGEIICVRTRVNPSQQKKSRLGAAGKGPDSL
jgi:hypothetical protein